MRNEFQVHRLNALGLEKADKLGNLFSTLLDDVEKLAGIEEQNERELAIVRTKLQEANFYAKRAMAVNSINQQ
jgi:hypothetical protein